MVITICSLVASGASLLPAAAWEQQAEMLYATLPLALSRQKEDYDPN